MEETSAPVLSQAKQEYTTQLVNIYHTSYL